MRIKVEKFLNTSTPIEVTFPSELRGANGAGKTRVLRALCYVLNQKDPKPTDEGKIADFNGRIYPENTVTSSEIVVRVELEHNGVKFIRESKPTSEQLKKYDMGEPVSLSLINKYFIENDGKLNVVTVAEYDRMLSEVFGAEIALQLDGANFFRLPIVEQRNFLSKLVDFQMFNTVKKDTVKSKISETKTEIKSLQGVVLEASQNAEELPDNADNSVKISDLTAKIVNIANAIPTLTAEEKEHNLDLENQIKELKMKSFREKPTLTQIDVAALRAELSDLKNQLQDVEAKFAINEKKLAIKVDLTLEKQAVEDAKIDFENTDFYECFEDFANAMQNEGFLRFPEILENIQKMKTEPTADSCFLCEKCTAHCDSIKSNFQALKIQLKADNRNILMRAYNSSINDYHNYRAVYLAKTNDLMLLEKSVPDYEFLNAENSKLATKKISLEQKIADLEAKIEEKNGKNKRELEKFEAELKMWNADLQSFNADITNKIAKLSASKIEPKINDNSEILEQAKKELADLQIKQKEFSENKGKIDYNKKLIADKQLKIKELNLSLMDLEKTLTSEVSAEIEHYSELQKKVNDILPTDFSVVLFKLRKGSDDVMPTFELLFQGTKYASGAEEVLRNALFCDFLRGKKSELPIFIDEFSKVVNADIIKKIKGIKNICILTPDEACKYVKVLNIN